MQAVEKTKSADGKDAKPAGKPVLRPFRANEARFFEAANTSWVMFAPAGSTPEEIEATPGIFDALDKVRAGDEITMRWDDSAFVAKYVVVNVSPGRVATALVYSKKFLLRDAGITGRKLHAGWAMRRASEREFSQGGFYTEEVATGLRILASGMPFPDEESAFRGHLDHARFRADGQPQYLP